MTNNDDIVARVESDNTAGGPLQALQSYLAGSCGHVSLDQRVIVQGYRFYPWMSDEIPHFFNKRTTTGRTNVAITLQCGLSMNGEDPFEDCSNTADARQIIESDSYDASIWVARITIGTRMYDVPEIAESSFVAQHPDEFRLLAEELIALGVLGEHGCPMCSDAHSASHADAA